VALRCSTCLAIKLFAAEGMNCWLHTAELYESWHYHIVEQPLHKATPSHEITDDHMVMLPQRQWLCGTAKWGTIPALIKA